MSVLATAEVDRWIAPTVAWEDRAFERLTQGYHRFVIDRIATTEERFPWLVSGVALIEQENGL